MVGRRYYCHYCHSSFPYSREGRLKHCGGQAHLRLRARHYEQFETARERYNALKNKEKCRKFLSSQGCNFGDECIYSHCNEEQLEALRHAAEQEAVTAEYGPLPSQLSAQEGLQCPKTSEDANRLIFSLRLARLVKNHSSLFGTNGFKSSNKLLGSSSALQQDSSSRMADLSFYEPLPPSLQSYSIGDVIAEPLSEWG